MADKFQNKYRIPSARLRNWDYSAEGIYFITICSAGHECYFGEIINKKMIFSEIGSLVQMEWERSFVIRSELFCDYFVIMPNHIHAIVRIEDGIFKYSGDELDDEGMRGDNNKDGPETHRMEMDSMETHRMEADSMETDSMEMDSMENETDGIEKETHSMENETDGIEKETHGIEKETDGIEKETDGIEKETDGIEKETHCRASLQGDSASIEINNDVLPSKFGVAYRSKKSISSFVASFKSVVTVKARKIHVDFGWQTRFHDHIIQADLEYQRIANYIVDNPANWEQDKFYRNK